MWSLAKENGPKGDRRRSPTLGGRSLLYLGMACLSVSMAATAAGREGGFCAAEVKQARKTAQQIAQEWPLRGHDQVTDYVQDLGMDLVRAAEDRSATWRFRVVRDYSVNAFSIGGGYIYVTEGAIRSAKTADELAAILAHEIGHQIGGHFCTLSRDRGIWDPQTWFSARKGERIGVGSITQVIDVEKELAADEIATRLLQTAGFDPYAMLRVTERLPLSQSASHLKDHRRLRSLKRLLGHLAPTAAEGSPEFDRMKLELGPA
ncbi:MAG: M48 family metallopeptidase [Gammaproteobacteria bacterium]